MFDLHVHTAPDIEPEDFDRCPVLLTHPGVDRMTEISLSRRFFDRLAAPKRMVVLEGASHMPTEEPGVEQMQRAVVEFMRERVNEGAALNVGKYCARASRTMARASMKFSK